MNNKSNANTLFSIVLAGILFLVGAQILDLSLVDMAAAVQQMFSFIG